MNTLRACSSTTDTGLYFAVALPLVAAITICGCTNKNEHWEFAVADMIVSGPAVDEEHVYFVGADGSAYCLERHNGRLIWATALAQGGLWASNRPHNLIKINGDSIFVPYAGKIFCLDRDDGVIRWATPSDMVIVDPLLICSGRIFCQSSDRNFSSIDILTGQDIETIGLDNTIKGVMTTNGRCIFLVVEEAARYQIMAIEPNSSKCLWKYEDDHEIVSIAADMESVIFIGDNMIYALDSTTGKMIWSFNYHDNGTYVGRYPSIVMEDRSVYFSTSGGKVISIDRRTGIEEWQYETNSPMPQISLADQNLIVEVVDSFLCLDRVTGNLISTLPAASKRSIVSSYQSIRNPLGDMLSKSITFGAVIKGDRLYSVTWKRLVCQRIECISAEESGGSIPVSETE